MLTEISISLLIKQLSVAIPSIIASTNVGTSVLTGLFKITNGNLKHILSYIVGIIVGLGFVLFNGLAIVTTPIWANYVFGGICGLIAAGSANSLYDWKVIETYLNKIAAFFGNNEFKLQLQAKTEAKNN